MNKKIKRIIALTLTISAFSVISAITPGTFLDITTKPVYASSYSPSSDELKSLTVKSTNGDTLDLRDGYNGGTVKLNDDKDYYVKLTDDSDGIKINATAKGEDDIVRIFTSDEPDATGIEPGEEIPLGKGDTTLYVRTYESLSEYRKVKDDEDNVTTCEEEYTVNVMKTTGSDSEDDTQDPIYLENIEINKGEITFLKQKTSYDIAVDESVGEIKITAPPEDDGDRVRIDGSLVDSNDSYKKTVSLDDGENEIKIKVTDDKDNQRNYTLNVKRGSSSSNNKDDVYLDNLTVSEGDIDFSADDTSYNVDVDKSVDQITIGAEPEDEDYLVTIDGKDVNSDDDYEKDVSLSKGENTIKVIVEDELNDKKRTYTLTINRGESEDTDTTDADGTNTTTNTTTDKKTGWIQTNAGWTYNDENGNQLKGWQYSNGKWYVLDKDGIMKTGWYKEETTAQSSADTSNNTTTTTTTTTTDSAKIETWYYLNSDGAMNTGWLLDSGKWYYLNTNGTMQTKTKTIDGKLYNFNNDGTLVI